ncbi:MAG: glutamate--tRNA ligase, partial [Eudoraea sp.]|nr:glutamate--tRNA ligase [Eudoraea sp.]NNJ39340.1 glutamate--tRNA ligase [Eudoraea sp.]
LKELTQNFSLERVHKSGARFDPDKTIWYNHQYLQNRSLEDLHQDFTASTATVGISLEKWGSDHIKKVLLLIRERANFPSDLWAMSRFFFEAPLQYDEKAAKKQWKPQTKDILNELIQALEGAGNFNDADQLEVAIKTWIGNAGYGFGQVMPPLRLALVGEMKGPHISNIMALVGKAESISRIKKAIETLG